jgi:hypothetical protein
MPSKEDLYSNCESDPTYSPEWHWITDQIALGSYPREEAFEEIRGAGINSIVCVMDMPPFYDTSVMDDAHYVPQHDFVRYEPSALVEGLRFLHRQVEAGRKVYVHCFAGISRSSFFVSAYLMLRENISFEEAVNRVRSVRSVCNPNVNLYDDELLEELRQSRDQILNPVQA